jgi:hypothetical protein
MNNIMVDFSIFWSFTSRCPKRRLLIRFSLLKLCTYFSSEQVRWPLQHFVMCLLFCGERSSVSPSTEVWGQPLVGCARLRGYLPSYLEVVSSIRSLVASHPLHCTLCLQYTFICCDL